MSRWGRPTKNSRKRNPRYFLNPGDVSGDGNLNIVDIVAIVNVSLNLQEYSAQQELAADYTQDSTVNVLDVVAIVNHILGYD